MARAIAAQDWDALNLTFNDLPGWWAMDDDAPELPVVSANLSAKNPQQDWPRWRRIDRGDLKIGVVGVSNAGVSFIATPEFVTGPIIEAATAAIQEAAKETDLLVLMAYQAPAEAKALAMQHPEIDVVIDTYKHREISKPFVVGEAIWVKADYQTQRLGELRLWIEDGEIVRALDRKIDLDPDVPDEPVMRRLMLDARKAVAAKQREVFGP
jgi:2',3'-cyclic-nucleotide 2'-phosphodiesterase (5'-nucleotidase family)